MLVIASALVLELAQVRPPEQIGTGEAAASVSAQHAKPAPLVEGVVVIAPKRDLYEEPEWSKRLDFSHRGEFGRSDTPYLRDRPTSGCKPMAGGATGVMGATGVAGGLVCVKPF